MSSGAKFESVHGLEMISKGRRSIPAAISLLRAIPPTGTFNANLQWKRRMTKREDQLTVREYDVAYVVARIEELLLQFPHARAALDNQLHTSIERLKIALEEFDKKFEESGS